MEYYSAITRDGIMPFAATRLDHHQSEVKLESERQTSFNIAYIWDVET